MLSNPCSRANSTARSYCFALESRSNASLSGLMFSLDSSLNEEVVIRPDGMITVQGIGDVKAVGLTPEELARRIEKKLVQADILDLSESMIASKKYKLVTVHVLKFYQKIDQLVKSLTTLTGGQQTGIRVNPDGTIDLPLVRERIIAAGQTVPALERTANMLYKRSGLKHVVVSLSLANARSRKVYVMGQVGSPGAYEIRQPITALHAIALAGGAITETADLTSVILISKNIHGKPIGRRLDLKRILDVGDMSPAILVKPYDVLFVPKTYIRDVQIFMNQYFSTVSQITQFVRSLSETQ